MTGDPAAWRPKERSGTWSEADAIRHALLWPIAQSNSEHSGFLVALDCDFETCPGKNFKVHQVDQNFMHVTDGEFDFL